jgi:hypothetical protein
MFGVNLRRVTLWLAASFFAWATLIFAAGPIRALRRTGTALSFWTGGFAAVGAFAAFGLWEAAIALGSVVLVAGSFTELEESGVARGTAAVISLVGLLATAGLGLALWCRVVQQRPLQVVSSWISPLFEKAKAMAPAGALDEITVKSIVYQTPSALLVLGLLTIAVAVMSERSWIRISGARIRHLAEGPELRRWTDLRIDDWVIWMLNVGLVAAFIQHGIEPLRWVGLNMLNVLGVLYFFQGMAVIFKIFEVFRIGMFWQMLFGLLLVLQLALIVAILGVADVWLDLRTRFTRRPMAPTSESSPGE